MDVLYVIIVGFLIILAVFDLFVGVSNDAVNFLNSAIGAKVAKFKTVLIIAAFGVLLGAITSNGMMDVARHGVMQPDHFTFDQAITVFLAVMVTDVIILDIFNNMGLPTSTTVSMVFELIGATFCLSVIKMAADSSLEFTDLLNASKALQMIVAIFVSVLIAFIVGLIVQWISRLAFTFNFKAHEKYCIAIFGGIAITIMIYFIFIQGLKSATFITDADRAWVNENFTMLVSVVFVVSAVLSEILFLLKVDVLKIVVLFGTFSLAMAFAGNDLVNFIGVPLAGLDAYQDYAANGDGQATSYLMSALMSSAKSPFLYLAMAAAVMIIAMGTSKKARNVIKTSVDLSAQGDGDEIFGSSGIARGLVRGVQQVNDWSEKHSSKKARAWINSRFNTAEIDLPAGAAFDTVRASVNLVFSAILIIIGTTQKLPLSTTYVTFMVAMGTSLADRAWGRENAVFRITGVLSVIGGWFMTAIVAFAVSAIVCLFMYFGGFVAKALFMALVIYVLWRSNRKFAAEHENKPEDDTFQLMMRAKDPYIVWGLLGKHVKKTQASVIEFTIDAYKKIVDGLANRSVSTLRHVKRDLDNEQDEVRRLRRREILGLRRSPSDLATERNTWYHLSINSASQYIYCLKRMLEPAKSHVDNNFNPLPEEYANEFQPMYLRIENLMKRTEEYIQTGKYQGYRDVMTEADNVKDELSVLRKRHIDRMQRDRSKGNYQISIVYLNIIQESQMLLSIMRHQLRATKKFTDETDMDLDI